MHDAYLCSSRFCSAESCNDRIFVDQPVGAVENIAAVGLNELFFLQEMARLFYHAAGKTKFALEVFEGFIEPAVAFGVFAFRYLRPLKQVREQGNGVGVAFTDGFEFFIDDEVGCQLIADVLDAQKIHAASFRQA